MRPPVTDRELAALLAQIDSAFSNTPYPGDRNLCGSDRGYEPAEVALELKGIAWQRLHPELAARERWALSFLSDVGFRYFLAAYMVADLLGYDLDSDPVFYLTHDFIELPDPETEDWGQCSPDEIALLKRYMREEQDRHWRDYSERLFAGFTREEREAIIAYLRFSSRLQDDDDRAEIEQALRAYWLPSCLW